MNSRYVICDIEATGLHEDKEIIEIALITLVDDKVVDIYETLVNPMLEVSEYIHNLTSISKRDLSTAPKFYEIADAIRMRLEGNVFVSHNTEFDLNLLKKKFREMGQELKIKSFCTLKVAQYEIPGLSNYSLDALCSFFFIKIRDRHRAIGDALATLELFRELINLKSHHNSKVIYLPQHEKILKDIPSQAGLIKLKDREGKILKVEACFDMEKMARKILEVRPENRHYLIEVNSIDAEITGCELIAEFKKLLYRPIKYRWLIGVQETNKERNFKLRPMKKGTQGLWYFQDFKPAKKKINQLLKQLQGDSFIYREGGKSKEEILKHNSRLELLSKEAKFPSDRLVIIGEGKCIGEKSLILVRDGHVIGYGYTSASEQHIYTNPGSYLNHRFFKHIAIDIATMNYLRAMKNFRTKKESWRSLAECIKINGVNGESL
jgi:DNA polymerase-3 subunit epsilon